MWRSLLSPYLGMSQPNFSTSHSVVLRVEVLPRQMPDRFEAHRDQLRFSFKQSSRQKITLDNASSVQTLQPRGGLNLPRDDPSTVFHHFVTPRNVYSLTGSCFRDRALWRPPSGRMLKRILKLIVFSQTVNKVCFPPINICPRIIYLSSTCLPLIDTAFNT